MKYTTERSKRTRAPLWAACLALATGQVLAAETPYDALYVFGDSYSDMGARYLDGNGPTPPGYLAQAMGIELTHSKDENPGTKSINFAATGASSGEDKEGKWCCQGMVDQVNDFIARVHAGKISFKPETTLFFLAGGLNDKDLKTEVTVDNIARQIELLRGIGARHFTLSLLPTKIPDWAAMGTRLNPAYERLVAELRSKQDMDIHLNQWGVYLDEIIQNPSQYGLVNTTSECAGRALLKQDPTPCANPDSYFYFHGGHPSTKVNKIVGEKLHRELAGLTKKPAPEG